jgi:HK97 family phage major capsid protein
MRPQSRQPLYLRILINTLALGAVLAAIVLCWSGIGNGVLLADSAPFAPLAFAPFLIGNLRQAQQRRETIRKSAQKRTDEIISLTGKENRAMTDAEKAELDGFKASIADCDLQIEAAKLSQEEERKGPASPATIPRAEEEAPFKTFGEQLRAVIRASIPGGAVDSRLKPLADASGANESSGSAGGFLVQSQFSTELLARASESSQLYSRCKRIPVGDGFNSVTLPFIDETSRANGSRFGGVQVFRRAEADTVAATRPKIANIKIDLESMMAIGYLTDELMQDATAMGAMMREAFISEIGFKTDDEILTGNGAGQMLGILNGANASLVTVAKETSQAATTIVAKNIMNMWSRMWARSRPNSAWLINQDTEPQLDQLALAVGVGGVPLYMPFGGLSTTPFSTLKGRPVIPMEQCATLGTLGDIVLVDLSQYLVIDKGSPEVAESMHVRFIYGENTLRVMVRNNGRPAWRTVLTPKSGSANTLSPFVALAARA